LRHFEPGDVEMFDSDEEDEEGGEEFHEDSF
jgi:hypothetical protein